jgi:hypothetical protein
MAMEKMLERAAVFAYRRAIALGADDLEGFETALEIIFDARPDIEDDAARDMLRAMLAAAPQLSERDPTMRAAAASSSTNRSRSLARVA